MLFHEAPRSAGGFQEDIPPRQILAMCRRAFGEEKTVSSVEELTGGLHNNTYRVDFADTSSAILRVSPAPRKQSRSERALLRNAHAALPFFAPIAAMMPKTLYSDWTHEVIGRDYLFQTVLPGESAASALARYPKDEWGPFYRQLGRITRSVHSVRGVRFGAVAGPTYAKWSEAVVAALENLAADLQDAGLEHGDMRAIADEAGTSLAVLDEIVEPRLLHGDLWTPNVMLDIAAPEPAIIGVLDHDRALWGDPAADWSIYVAATRPSWAQAEFRATYGEEEPSPERKWRSLIYQAWHTGSVQLERLRHDKHDKLSAGAEEIRAIREALARHWLP